VISINKYHFNQLSINLDFSSVL